MSELKTMWLVLDLPNFTLDCYSPLIGMIMNTIIKLDIRDEMGYSVRYAESCHIRRLEPMQYLDLDLSKKGTMINYPMIMINYTKWNKKLQKFVDILVSITEKDLDDAIKRDRVNQNE